jgi:hypothetical protein
VRQKSVQAALPKKKKKKSMNMSTWELLAASYRAKQLEAIPASWVLTDRKKLQLGLNDEESRGPGRLIASKAVPKCGILSHREIEITENYNAVDLIREVAEGAMTAEEVTVAFCKRAAVAQQMVTFSPPRRPCIRIAQSHDSDMCALGQLPDRGLLQGRNRESQVSRPIL